MKNHVINSILENKIVVIVRGVDKEKLIPLAEAMYEGGIRLIEITYSATNTPTAEETAENIRTLAEHFEGRMFIGAGTVLNEKQVELTKAAGGSFIPSGIISRDEMLDLSKSYGIYLDSHGINLAASISKELATLAVTEFDVCTENKECQIFKKIADTNCCYKNSQRRSCAS